LNKLTSIIVLSYNNLEITTKPCIESILKNTRSENYELIIVDNASTDKTQNYLKEISSKNQHVKLCLNESNKGFSAGNNDGIRISSGEYIVLLNNDTLVPKGWLKPLIKNLSKRNVGLVGPLTNSAGNEQCINIENLNESNYEKKIKHYLSNHHSEVHETQRLGFFCVAMNREVLNTIGYLEERFGVGMFEDDDYCIRVLKKKYLILIAEDCFVFHKGSISFNKLSTDIYRELFEKNKILFESIHKTQWTFADIALSYWDKLDKDLAQYKKNHTQIDPAIENVLVRWENFRHILVQIELERLKVTGDKKTTKLKKGQWDFRWNNFKIHLIYGSWQQRFDYFKNISKRFNKYLNARFKKIFTVHNLKKENSMLRDFLNSVEIPPTNTRFVIFPPTIDYSYMKQRPQMIANAFAKKGYFVIYGTKNYNSDQVEIAKKISSNFYVINEKFFSFLSCLVEAKNSTFFCMWPNNIKHLMDLDYNLVIYDYMDELKLLEPSKSSINENHQKMMDAADIISVSISKLKNKIPDLYKNKSILIPNAVSEDFIKELTKSKKIPPEILIHKHKKIIGYYGAISKWFDFNLMQSIAESWKDNLVVLIGPISKNVEGRVARLKKINSNIIFLSNKDQLHLIPYLKKFDICIIPFIKNVVTNSVSPVKLYEYFSAGKPVISTDIYECKNNPLVFTASSYDEFNQYIYEILYKNKVKNSKIFKDYAKKNTWMCRVTSLENFAKKIIK
jgi:GT2 family glycosyltransferase